MSDGMLLVERMVLESIGSGAASIKEIAADTKINDLLVVNILSALGEQKMIERVDGRYQIIADGDWKKLMNQKEFLKEEVKELFVSLVNQYFSKEQDKTKLRVRKVWMTPFEEKILNSHFYNLEQFIKGLERSSVKKPQHQKRVILWGDGHYTDLVERLLEVG